MRTDANSEIAVATRSVPAKRRASRVLSDWSIVGDLVADAPHRRHGAALAELSAQLAHVHVHRARVAGERVSPDALEQLVARQDEPAMVEQLPEQVELLR